MELTEQPEGVQEAEVIVTFLSKNGVEKVDKEVLRPRFFQRMDQGFPVGGKGYVNRDEIYKRAIGAILPQR